MSDNFVVNCPHCQQPLSLRHDAAGKQARCPACTNIMIVPMAGPDVATQSYAAPAPPRPAPPRQPDPYAGAPSQAPFGQAPAYGAQPSEAAPTSPFDIKAESATDRSRRKQSQGGGAFAPEKKGIDAGMLGGVLMMIIAAVWFFAGLSAGFIFYYPPILFLIGIYATVKGLITGNVAGNNRRRRR